LPAEKPLEIFLHAQASQAATWLLNYKLYAVVVVLLAVSFVRPIYRWAKPMWVNVAHDYFYGVFHTLVVFPFLALFIYYLQRSLLAAFPALDLKLYSYLPGWVQVVLAFLITDFLGYLSHLIRHKVRPLWFFHVIHHSQRRVNPLTVKRSHFFEKLIDPGLFKTVPFIVMGSPVQTFALFYALDAAWDYFQHSNLDTDLGPLRYVLVSPRYHQLHHSRLPEHVDKNFSDRLVLWDLVFGTASFDYRRSFPTGVDAPGLALEDGKGVLGALKAFGNQLVFPFRRNYAYFKHEWRRMPSAPAE